jgi:2-keto-4-pentenoate hydratase/2-oxohepta-3-ene-1,7-dioic acid hydratase in catechol pathway
MKIGRVSHQGKVRMVLVDEAARSVAFIGGNYSRDLNPVQTVVERRIGEAELRALQEGVAGFDEVSFLSPISVPVRNIFAVGKNYTEHAAEFDKSGFNATSGAAAIPAFPQLFTKATTSLAGPTDDIRFDPAHTSSVDYEGEIGVVIGTECRNVDPAAAMDKVFGFIALNDVTARDLQKNHAQWFLGKSLDTFCPVGPWITTTAEATAQPMQVQTWVNGERRQAAHLTDLIFDVPTLISTLSKAMTLLPGDIIATGTPVGVGIGFTPPKFLQNGDVVKVAITTLGELNNRVRSA